MSVEQKVGFCTLCRSRCGTINTVENGRLISVAAAPDHPTGKATCAKGRAAPEIAHSARRLLKPMRRTRPKTDPDPGWQEISWDEAIDEIARRLIGIRDESGPEAVAFAVSSPSGTSLSDSYDWLERLIRMFGSPNQCNATEICNWHKDFAHIFTFGSGIPTADFAHPDLILLWGYNPANSWLAQAGAVVDAHARGAKLIVVDPRRAGLARHADHWLGIRKEWARDAARRRKAGIPEEIGFQTKPEIALEQLRWACTAGLARGVAFPPKPEGSRPVQMTLMMTICPPQRAVKLIECSRPSEGSPVASIADDWIIAKVREGIPEIDFTTRSH